MNQEYPEATLQECIDYAIEREHCALVDEVNAALNIARQAMDKLSDLVLKRNRPISGTDATPGRTIDTLQVQMMLVYCQWILGEAELAEQPNKDEIEESIGDDIRHACLTETANAAVTLASINIERLQAFTTLHDLQMVNLDDDDTNFDILDALSLWALLGRIVDQKSHT